MRKRASQSSAFVAAALVAALSCVSEAAHADEDAHVYGPPPAADVVAPKAKEKALVQLHVYTPADAPHAQLYEREGIRDTLVCSSPCHPTVAYDAHLVARLGVGASSKPIDLSLGSELDVIVKPATDYHAVGWLAVVGAVGATTGSVYLFANSKAERGEMGERIGHFFRHAGGGLGLLAVGAGLAYLGVGVILDPGPKPPRVIVKAVS